MIGTETVEVLLAVLEVISGQTETLFPEGNGE